MSVTSPPLGIRDPCDTPACDNDRKRDTSWERWASNGMEKTYAIIDLAVPPAYSNMARDTVGPAFQSAFKVCLSASAQVATAAKVALDPAMGWTRTVGYPWGRAAAEDAVNIVTTNAVSLSQAGFRSSSAWLSAALELVRDLSGSSAVRATEVITATAASLQECVSVVLGAAADDFWSSAVGRTVTTKVTPLLMEGTTAVLDAAGAFWARPAMKAARETALALVEKVAATFVDAVFQLWTTSAAVGGGRHLVKIYLLDDGLVSRSDRFTLPCIHSVVLWDCSTNWFYDD